MEALGYIPSLYMIIYVWQNRLGEKVWAGNTQRQILGATQRLQLVQPNLCSQGETYCYFLLLN